MSSAPCWNIGGKGRSFVMYTIQRLIGVTLYRYGWDTRSRNFAAARTLRTVFADLEQTIGPALLDVGCGDFGLRVFLPTLTVIGVDRDRPEQTFNTSFVSADIKTLPFSDRSVPVVSCIDVLEHLSPGDRERALRELVRVAGNAVLITFPYGKTARGSDEDLRRRCESRGRTVPRWVFEHLEHPYPVSSKISSVICMAAADSGRTADISLSYNELTSIGRVVRAAAARSDSLYIAVNLLFGILGPIVPEARAGNSYRTMMLVRLEGG